MYVKLFSSILTSSIWAEDVSTRIVWITLLAMADREGFARGSQSGLARMANVSAGDCARALTCLAEPDVESQSQEWGGRRIEVLEGGWLILNYVKYRDLADAEARRETFRKSSKRYRNRQQSSTPSTARHGKSTEADADTEADTKAVNGHTAVGEVDLGELARSVPNDPRVSPVGAVSEGSRGKDGKPTRFTPADLGLT